MDNETFIVLIIFTYVKYLDVAASLKYKRI